MEPRPVPLTPANEGAWRTLRTARVLGWEVVERLTDLALTPDEAEDLLARWCLMEQVDRLEALSERERAPAAGRLVAALEDAGADGA